MLFASRMRLPHPFHGFIVKGWEPQNHREALTGVLSPWNKCL
jgi:hypothetical protein